MAQPRKKIMESAQADFNDAATDVQNSLQALKIFGITKQEIDQAERQGVPISPELAVLAPICGRSGAEAGYRRASSSRRDTTACFMLSDVSTVWVQGHIFDRDLPSVRSGDAVEETNPSFAQTFHGMVSYIGALVDPATRTTPVRIVTRNPGGLLKKDMFVDAVIHTRTQKHILTRAGLRRAAKRAERTLRLRRGAAGQVRAAPGRAGAQQDEPDGDPAAVSRRERTWFPRAASFSSSPTAISKADTA